MTEGSHALSIIVLAWDQLHHTTACVDSLRRHTDVDYELIIVDNGSAPAARAYAQSAADVAVLNDRNLGFAGGMNSGLAVASGRVTAFVNNDTTFPPGWAAPLLQTLAGHPRAAVVVPAVTAARHHRSVRDRPGRHVEVLAPFEPVPAAVVWLMPTDVVRGLAGFDERYFPASGEDVDLAFTVWVNDRDIVYDSRVLIDHVGKGTAAEKLESWRSTWRMNAAVFLNRWAASPQDVPRLPDLSEDRFQRNLRTATAIAGWMQRYYTARERRVPLKGSVERLVAVLQRSGLAKRVRHRWSRRHAARARSSEESR